MNKKALTEADIRTKSTNQESVATQDYYDNASQKSSRYYQLIAINRTVDAIARGLNRILLVMATGTGNVDHLLPEYEKLLAQIGETRGQLKAQLMEALIRQSPSAPQRLSGKHC